MHSFVISKVFSENNLHTGVKNLSSSSHFCILYIVLLLKWNVIIYNVLFLFCSLYFCYTISIFRALVIHTYVSWFSLCDLFSNKSPRPSANSWIHAKVNLHSHEFDNWVTSKDNWLHQILSRGIRLWGLNTCACISFLLPYNYTISDCCII